MSYTETFRAGFLLHESQHLAQYAKTSGFLAKYLVSPKFRFNAEMEASRGNIFWLCANGYLINNPKSYEPWIDLEAGSGMSSWLLYPFIAKEDVKASLRKHFIEYFEGKPL